MRIVFIRHGLTAGNLQKRYIGVTDEPLCREGRDSLSRRDYPRCEILVCSPMQRCLQTAKCIFPQQEPVVYSGLRECDFGDFEGKNHIGLSGDPAYQRWIDSGGSLPFPNGESPEHFKERCIRTFDSIVGKYSASRSVCFIVHGGTIMSVLEKYGVPRRDYYDLLCENGHGYVCEWDGTELNITEKI